VTGPRIAVVHPDAVRAPVGRVAVLRPANPHVTGLVLWNEHDNTTFDEDVARLAAITGYPVTDEHL
jgi:hypothetical protein